MPGPLSFQACRRLCRQQSISMKYSAPAFHGKAFTCPHCEAYAHMGWAKAYTQAATGGWNEAMLHTAWCAHCQRQTVWRNVQRHDDVWVADDATMIWPDVQVGPPPHGDMPELVKADYVEAQSICARSPRGAAALLRLCIDKLARLLLDAAATDDVNTNIGLLVKAGLPPQIQQALDIVRVVGNKSVHPGELSVEDVASVAARLFELVNAIVEDRIARPRELAKLYAVIPEKAMAGIEKRDQPQTTKT